MPRQHRKLLRCPWPGIDHPDYVRYHDEEWGVPKGDDRYLFEKLILEGFQAGLSWLTILRKRENFRRAFHNFDAERMARYGKRDIARLMQDAGIVRNRLKIESAVDNAKAYLSLRDTCSLAEFLWDFHPDASKPVAYQTIEQVPAETAQSARLSKALKAKGFRFVGPTTTYAFMQSVGLVNDHLTSCPRHTVCAKLQRSFVPPSPPQRKRTRVPVS